MIGVIKPVVPAKAQSREPESRNQLKVRSLSTHHLRKAVSDENMRKDRIYEAFLVRMNLRLH